MKLIFTIFLLFTLSVSFAQVIPNSTNTVKKHSNKSSKKAAEEPSSSIIKFVSDTDCTVYVDAENKGILKKGLILKVQLNHLGDYIFTAVGTNAADIISDNYTVNDLGTETIHQFNLVPHILVREQKEAVSKLAQNQPPPLAILKIAPDTDCTIYVDGENHGLVKTGDVLKLKLNRGSYQIKAIGPNPNDILIQDYKTDDGNNEVLLNIKLRPTIYTRIEKEITAKKEKTATEIPMIFVDGGAFDMGSKQGQKDEKPIHKVTVTGFYIGRNEITQGQWTALMGSNPSTNKGCDDCPVENVTWLDVRDYIDKLNTKTSKHYRLPTEAEWEYAAMGGKSGMKTKYSGSDDPATFVWFKDNSENKTHEVGKMNPNALKIFDMSGNVWEWCSDYYDPKYYKGGDMQDPKGPEQGTNRILRGGSFSDAAESATISVRMNRVPYDRAGNFGFRLVLDAAQ